jgi:hypothetical protein
MRATLPLRHALTPPGGAIKGESTRNTPEPCACCLGDIGTGHRFCSPRCRLLHWAAREMVKEYLAGRADGLRAIIEKLRP